MAQPSQSTPISGTARSVHTHQWHSRVRPHPSVGQPSAHTHQWDSRISPHPSVAQPSQSTPISGTAESVHTHQWDSQISPHPSVAQPSQSTPSSGTAEQNHNTHPSQSSIQTTTPISGTAESVGQQRNARPSTYTKQNRLTFPLVFVEALCLTYFAEELFILLPKQNTKHQEIISNEPNQSPRSFWSLGHRK